MCILLKNILCFPIYQLNFTKERSSTTLIHLVRNIIKISLDVEVDLPRGTFQERFNRLESFCKLNHQDTTVPVKLKNLDIKFASKYF